jgi:hypothetical protein
LDVKGRLIKMKILKVVKKLLKIYARFGNLEVGLPQVSEGDDGTEHGWLAEVTTIDVDENEKTLLIY